VDTEKIDKTIDRVMFSDAPHGQHNLIRREKVICECSQRSLRKRSFEALSLTLSPSDDVGNVSDG
jgi:hypothetical protein